MNQWTYRQAWFCLIGSTLATLSISLFGYWIWHQWHVRRLTDERYKIVAIVQTGPEREALKTPYLAELLNLSQDQPVSLYAFDLKLAERALRSCPLICDAHLQRVPPGTIYVDYTIRRPIAFLADYQNTGIDRDGFLFPIVPFYSPKNLPEIYLGLPPFNEPEDVEGRKGGEWQRPLQNRYLPLAMDILHILEGAPWREGMRLKRIDVSSVFAASAGVREIVLDIEDEIQFRKQDQEIVCIFPKILRLPAHDYAQQLANFFSLRRTMLEDYQRQIAEAHYTQPSVRFAPRIIDLRIPQMALVQNQ